MLGLDPHIKKKWHLLHLKSSLGLNVSLSEPVMSDSWEREREGERRRRRKRRREKEGVEAKEEGNGTSEMFPITGVEKTEAEHGLTLETERKRKRLVFVRSSFSSP